MSETPDDALDELIRAGWAEHADHTEAVAQRLAERAGRPMAAHLPRFVGLLVHVYGEHLGRWDEGMALLRQLPTADASIARGIATLAYAAGHADAGQALTAADRAAARAQAASALAERGSLASAIGQFQAALAEGDVQAWADSSPAIRALAVSGNNLAQKLEALATRSADETAAMRRAAEVSLAMWGRCGGWLEHERAEYRVARSLWQAGDPAAGLAHAEQCLAVCAANEAPVFERFFGHAIAAVCARAASLDTAFERHHEQALLAWAEVAPDDKGWCADDLASLRQAAGDTHPGRCTCGQIRFRLRSSPMFVHACHCRWCQRETGGAFVLNALIETDRIECLQGEPLRVTTPSASGQGQQVLRCANCHVALWSHYPGAGPTAAFVRVGTLLDPDRLPPDIHIFTSTKQPWLTLPEGVPAVPEYYDRQAFWPAASLARRDALLARSSLPSPVDPT